jgi:hypothetical protein
MPAALRLTHASSFLLHALTVYTNRPMPQPQLHQHGVFTPASLAYNHRIPAAILQTWMQLRGLVQEGTNTPPINIAELIQLIGKSQSCLYRHMTLLKALGVLDWFFARRGMVIISFASEPDSLDQSPGSGCLDPLLGEGQPPEPRSDSQECNNASQFIQTASPHCENTSQNCINDVQIRGISPPSSSIAKNLLNFKDLKRGEKYSRSTQTVDPLPGVKSPTGFLAQGQTGILWETLRREIRRLPEEEIQRPVLGTR